MQNNLLAVSDNLPECESSKIVNIEKVRFIKSSSAAKSIKE